MIRTACGREQTKRSIARRSSRGLDSSSIVSDLLTEPVPADSMFSPDMAIRIIQSLCHGLVPVNLASASENGMKDEIFFEGKSSSEWLSLLETGDPAQRQQAVDVWKRISKAYRDAVPRLLQVLKGEDEAVRLHAMGVLGDLGHQAHTMSLALRAALHQIAARDANTQVRGSAAEALTQIGPQANTPIPALIDTLHDELPIVRQGAAHALGEMGPAAKTAAAALISSLRDEDLSVRLQAAWALWKIDRRDRIAVPVLCKILAEGDDIQRWMAADCLGDMGELAADALPALQEALTRPTKAALIRKGIELAIERIEPAGN